VQMPMIEFTLIKRNLTFCKYIEKEFMIYLLQNNFIIWDTHLLNYLIRYKYFRQNINLKNGISSLERVYYYLDKDHYTIDENNATKVVTSKRNRINYLDYYITDVEGIVKFYKVKSYSFQVQLNMFEKNQKFSYPFNFKHFLTLEKLRKLCDLKDYLPKILMINYKTESVGLDSKYFDNVEDHYLKFLVD